METGPTAGGKWPTKRSVSSWFGSHKISFTLLAAIYYMRLVGHQTFALCQAFFTSGLACCRAGKRKHVNGISTGLCRGAPEMLGVSRLQQSLSSGSPCSSAVKRAQCRTYICIFQPGITFTFKYLFHATR